MFGLRLNRAELKLTKYRWPWTSSCNVSEPGGGPEDRVYSATSAPSAPSHSEMRTTGELDGSNVPLTLGAETSGGSQKKWELPPPWAPSWMVYDGEDTAVGVGASVQATAKRTTETQSAWVFTVSP